MPFISQDTAVGRHYDICIVGSGPAGIAAALTASERGQSVLLVEAGKKTPDANLYSWPETDIVHPEFHASRAIGASRGVGGTSTIWGGACVALEPRDLAGRDWPVSFDALDQHRAEASALLGCGTTYDAPLPKGWAPVDGVDLGRIDRLSTHKDVAVSQSARLEAATGPDILTEAEVIRVHATRTADGTLALTGARFRDSAGAVCPKPLKADRFVMACGGLETTRLMLLLQRDYPELFGGQDGPLGRGYMGHLSGTIAQVQFANPADVKAFGYTRAGEGDYVRRRIMLSAQADRTAANAGFWIGNMPLWDANHRSAGLSAKCLLAMTAKRIGLGPARDVIDSAIGTGKPSLLRHARNLGANPVTAVTETLGVVHRYATGMPAPIDMLTPNASGRYALRYQAEHVGAGDNRIVLEDFGSGQTRLRVDFRFSDAAADAVIEVHKVLMRELRPLDRMHIVMERDLGLLRAAILDQASDGFHQIGTTRMGPDAKTGVVDANCRAFGVENLFVASSSIFPTSTQASPTLTIAALAIRLGHHLADQPTTRRARELERELAE